MDMFREWTGNTMVKIMLMMGPALLDTVYVDAVRQDMLVDAENGRR